MAIKTICIPILRPTKRKEAVLNELLSLYRGIVREAVDCAWESGISSRKRLHDRLYRELRAKCPSLPSHYIYTAFTMALGIVKSFRKSKNAKRDKPEVTRLSSIMLDDYHLFKVNRRTLRLYTQSGHIHLPLNPTKRQAEILPSVKQGTMLVKRGDAWFLNAVVKREIKPYEPQGLMAYDVNEKSIDALLVKEGDAKWVHIDISEVRHVQKRYQQIRERKRRYDRGRAKRRINHLLHVTTKYLTELAHKEGVAIVTEDIKGINKGVNKKGRKIKRRLNLWPHGRIRFQMSYKSDWLGVLKLKDVEPSGNSKACPICGEHRARNGWVFKCSKCGVKTSSHLIACINILRRATSDEPSRIPYSAKALISLSPKLLVATVKGIVDLREEPRG